MAEAYWCIWEYTPCNGMKKRLCMCSACKAKHKIPIRNGNETDYKYCPFCGAEMETKIKEDEIHYA